VYYLSVVFCSQEVRLACSGRDELCRSVLNDIWVSHPTWASEEAGFVAHKKNSFEEALHKSEEERHEYHVHIEALTRTIAIMDRLYSRIEEMSNEERALFKLKSDFGGSSKSIYHRILKRIYGKDAGLEVIQALQDCPAVAVPVVLARLKQKDEEWRRAQRDWNRTWRDVDARNFYKSLDHQGIIFKANDKKNITAKYFVTEIEILKAKQAGSREHNQPKPSCTFGSTGNQLQYTFEDTAVLHDSLKMVYSFLDHSHTLYTAHERRGVEKFLRSFIPVLCKYPVTEFNAACGPLDDGEMAKELSGSPESQRKAGRLTSSPRSNGATSGIPAIDLRKKLLKTASSNKDHRDLVSIVGSQPSSPSHNSLEPADWTSSTSHRKQEDVWIREGATNLPRDEPSLYEFRPQRRSFFANSTFYTLLRLLQV
jgi:paired amphipathic helix protein Sin3a